MNLVYANEPFPQKVVKSIFLAGPTPRTRSVLSWRPDAIALLRESAFDGHVFIPEARDGDYTWDYTDQVGWEEEGLHRADVILFWIPREMTTLPGLTTNIEFGVWMDSGKVVLGIPTEAEGGKYPAHYAGLLGMSCNRSLPSTVAETLGRLGEGSPRAGGEVHVPLHLWSCPSFQNWYRDLEKSGNRLEGGRLLWSYRTSQKTTFFWAYKPRVFIAKEGRRKTNEIVFSRPGISSTVLFAPREDWRETRVVLVREFRSTVSNSAGYVLECPSGSRIKPVETLEDALDMASEEVAEETGLAVDPSRFLRVRSAQLMSTMSAHKASLFSVRLTDAEIEAYEKRAASGEACGLEGDTERTFVEVCKVGQLLSDPRVDWSTLGMILSVTRGTG